MPFVSRDNSEQITGVYRTQQKDAAEELPATHKEVIDFVFGEDQALKQFQHKQFAKSELDDLTLSDLGLIRVLEDLIHILVERSVIDLTDLPEAAISRLQSRQSMRGRLDTIKNILGNDLLE